MRLSCIALPDEVASEKIRGLMNQYSDECGSVKALAFLPHFSLWGDFEIESEYLSPLKERLALTASDALPLQVTLRRYGFYPWRIVYLDIEKIDALQKLHASVMSAVLQYRTQWVPQTLLESVHFDGKQRQYIEQFGYQFAGEFYSPHFTLAGNDMSENDFQVLVGKLEQKREHINVRVTKIALVERDSGTNAVQWTSTV